MYHRHRWKLTHRLPRSRELRMFVLEGGTFCIAKMFRGANALAGIAAGGANHDSLRIRERLRAL